MHSFASHNEGGAGWASSLAQLVRCLFAVAAALMAWGAPPAESSDDLMPGLRGQGPARLELHDGRLSVSIRDRPWVEVLGELRRATGMALRVEPEPTGTVTLFFEQTPLEEGLKRLFGGDAGVILYYETASSAVPLEARVVPRGTSAPEGAAPAPLRVDLPPAIRAAFDRVDPALRARAVRAFRTMPRDWLLSALQRLRQRDPALEVRGTDGNALASIGALRALGAAHQATSQSQSSR